jgi:acetylornithine deacetylase/succinyl-diaminopimelate desuccinylase-like protein
MERIPIIKNPELFDRVIANIQKGLADGLPWLNYSFGRSERLVKSIQGKRYYTPNIYVGGNEYMLIAPDSNIGNFSFFVLDDPQQIDWFPGEQNKYTTPFSVIFWFDMRTITNDPNNRNTEAVKQQIMRVLNGGMPHGQHGLRYQRFHRQRQTLFPFYPLRLLRY